MTIISSSYSFNSQTRKKRSEGPCFLVIFLVIFVTSSSFAIGRFLIAVDRVSIKIFQNMPEEAPWDKIRVRDAGYNLLHNNGKKNSVRWK